MRSAFFTLLALAGAVKNMLLPADLVKKSSPFTRWSDLKFQSFCWAVLVGCSAIATTLARPPSLTLTETISLPGVEGRIDHLACDSRGDRLFVCALGNDSVEVIDLRRGQRVHSISGLGSPQGISYLPDANRIFVASDRAGTCHIYEAGSFRQVGQVELGDDADNVRYNPVDKNIHVGFGNGGIAIIDPATGKKIGSFDLPAHPEAFELERKGNRIFVNLPEARRVGVIDRVQAKVVTTWSTGSAFANFPMALDETDHRLFVGCRTPAKLIAINTDSGEIVSKVDISGDCDDLFYDMSLHRIYAICGAGTVDLVDQINADTYKNSTRIETAPGARTGLFVPQLDRLFVAVPHRGSQAAEIRVYQVP